MHTGKRGPPIFVPWVKGIQISVGSLLRQGRQAVQVPGTRALLGPQKPLECWAAGAQLTQQGQAAVPRQEQSGVEEPIPTML